jgi:DNA-binding MarR family transcriptional regulator
MSSALHQQIQSGSVLPKLLDDAKQLVLSELHSRLAAGGYPDVRPSHGCVFRWLPEEGLRLSELATLNDMTKQAIGEHVDELVERGYVERVPDPVDGRAKLVRPTAKGREVMALARKSFGEIEAEWGERVGERRVAQLRETLEAILTQD